MAVNKASKAQGATVKATKGAQAGNVTAEQIAATVGATGKDFRRWLRATLRANGKGDAMAGKGGRYTFTQAQAASIVTAYGARKARQGNGDAGVALASIFAPAKATRAPRAPRKAAVTVSHVAPIGALEAPSPSQA